MGAAICREAAALYDTEQHHCTNAAHVRRATYSPRYQGTSGNMGMYAAGIPVGLITDRKSPRLAGLIGMLSLFAGYYPIHIGMPAIQGQKLSADNTSLR